MGVKYKVNSDQALNSFIQSAKELYQTHKYVIWVPHFGRDRSLDQNALFHVWCTEYAAFLLECPKKDVSPEVLEGMKRTAKRECYLETGEPYLVHHIMNPRTHETKLDFASSTKWKRGEMFTFLTWLQNRAGLDGCLLESSGEFKELQDKSNGLLN